MQGKYLTVIVEFLCVFVVVNLLLLDFIWISNKNDKTGVIPSVSVGVPLPSSAVVQSSQDGCGSDCKRVIEQEVNRILTSRVSLSPKNEPTPTIFTTSVLGPKVVYLPITNSGSTIDTSWVDIIPSDFYFNKNDYPGMTGIRWEVYLKAEDGGSKVYARLYDVTNKRGVDYSDVSTQSNSSVLLISSDLRIWNGNNLYRVQLKSENGTQAILSQSRFKVLF